MNNYQSKSLFALTAADVMSDNLVKFTEDTPLCDAAQRLVGERISGAPVVDASGVCVGVLSTTDFLHEFVNRRPKHGPVEKLPTDEVRNYMTADPVTVFATESLQMVARHMINGGVRRVIVVDTFFRPIGIVSATDILATFSYAEDESKAHASILVEVREKITWSTDGLLRRLPDSR